MDEADGGEIDQSVNFQHTSCSPVYIPFSMLLSLLANPKDFLIHLFLPSHMG